MCRIENKKKTRQNYDVARFRDFRHFLAQSGRENFAIDRTTIRPVAESEMEEKRETKRKKRDTRKSRYIVTVVATKRRDDNARRSNGLEGRFSSHDEGEERP